MSIRLQDIRAAVSLVAPGDFERLLRGHGLMAGVMPIYYDFEVSLREVTPTIWRRVLMPRTATFAQLHQAIQDACGWLDYHLYSFYSTQHRRSEIAASPHREQWGNEPEAPAATRVRVSTYFTGDPLQSCLYVYDYGDSWEHDVVVRNIVELRDKFRRRLVGGERAFPPEDCGGIPGYERIVRFCRTGVDELEDDSEGLREWLNGWEPDRFDFDAVRAKFDR